MLSWSLKGSDGDRVWLSVCCAVHESSRDRGMHGICGEKGPRLRLWSNSPAWQDGIKATVQERKAGLLSTPSWCK
jgi:hypothetical protein